MGPVCGGPSLRSRLRSSCIGHLGAVVGVPGQSFRVRRMAKSSEAVSRIMRVFGAVGDNNAGLSRNSLTLTHVYTT